MATPFFKGNYGSALARVDTRPVIEAGRATGQMYANMGAQVGGAIQQYGLNKEKQKKADARVKSALNGMPEYVQAGVLSPEQKTMAEEFLNDPNKSSAEKVAFIEEQEKRLFQLPKVLLAKSQADMAKTQARVADLTAQNEVATSAAKLVTQNYINNKTKLEAALLQTQSENEKEKIRSQLDILEEQKKQLSQGNQFFKKTFEDRVTQEKLKTSGAEQTLVENSLKILALHQQLNNSTDKLEREKLEAQIENINEDTRNKAAEAGLFEAQAQQLTALSEDEPSDVETFDLPEGIDVAASGDLPGNIKGAINSLGDWLSLGTRFEEDRDARAKVEVLRAQLMPAFLNTISERGSQWAKEEVERFILDPDDGDGKFRAKLRELPNILRSQVAADKAMLKLGKVGTETQRGQAARNVIRFPLLIESLEKIIARDITQGEAETEEDLLRKFDP
tara:strand:+ start:329 stop:1675 length:1347 start_codon:yes stop_codon:yes gene_type:complete